MTHRPPLCNPYHTELSTSRLHGLLHIDFESGIDGVYGRPYSELVYWSIIYTATEVLGVDRVTLAYRGSVLREIGEPTVAVPAAAGRADAPDWARPR